MRMIQVTDKGSNSHQAEVFIQGVPAEGLIDSGVEITCNHGRRIIQEGSHSQQIEEKDFKKPDKIPKTQHCME